MRTFLVLIAIYLLGAPPLLANDKAPQGFGSGVDRDVLVEELRLTPDQQEKLTCDTPGQGKALKERAETEKKRLNDMLRDRSASREAIYEQFERTQQALNDFESHRLEKILIVRDTLTSKQLSRFFEIKNEHQAKVAK